MNDKQYYYYLSRDKKNVQDSEIKSDPPPLKFGNALCV